MARSKRKKKLKNHDYMRTLTELEMDDWGEPNYPSHVVVECHRLRKKPINDSTVEDFRLMIGQRISLEILMPKAIPLVQENPLASGDFYDGDLLVNILAKGKSYLQEHEEDKDIVLEIISENKNIIEEESTTLNKKLVALAEEI